MTAGINTETKRVGKCCPNLDEASWTQVLLDHSSFTDNQVCLPEVLFMIHYYCVDDDRLSYSPLQPGDIQSIIPPSPTTRLIQSVADAPVPAAASFRGRPGGQVLSITEKSSKFKPAFAAASRIAGFAASGNLCECGWNTFYLMPE